MIAGLHCDAVHRRWEWRMIAVIDRRENIAMHRHTCAVSDRKEIYINAVGDRTGYVFESRSHIMLTVFMVRSLIAIVL